MNVARDPVTGISGLGRTPQEAQDSLRFNVERSGRLTQATIMRQKELHAWLPKPNMIHVKGVGAIIYENGFFVNLRTGSKIKAYHKPLSHYLYLFNAFDGFLSYVDFTITLGSIIDSYLCGLSGNYLRLDDFPYIRPATTERVKHYHCTYIPGVNVIETNTDTIIVSCNGVMSEVDKVAGISDDCLLAYLFSSTGFLYDGTSLRRIKG